MGGGGLQPFSPHGRRRATIAQAGGNARCHAYIGRGTEHPVYRHTGTDMRHFSTQCDRTGKNMFFWGENLTSNWIRIQELSGSGHVIRIRI